MKHDGPLKTIRKLCFIVLPWYFNMQFLPTVIRNNDAIGSRFLHVAVNQRRVALHADKTAVADPQDIVEIHGLPPRVGQANRTGTPGRFLSVWFRCCHTYGRMYRNAQQTQYVGSCPKCGARVSASIGPGGTNRRMFEAR